MACHIEATSAQTDLNPSSKLSTPTQTNNKLTWERTALEKKKKHGKEPRNEEPVKKKKIPLLHKNTENIAT